MTQADIGESHSSDEDIVDEYDEFTWTGTQPERPSINAYYGRPLARVSNEAGEVLMLPEGSKGSYNRMRNFVEMVRRRCWRMVTKMNCTVAGDVVQPAVDRSGLSRATSSRATTSTSAA